jgi:Flp pilus assembly protein protease CpaA
VSLDVAAKASHVAVLGWGVGLTFVGLGLILAGIFILFNFRNLGGRYFKSTVSAGSPLSFL